MQVGGQLSIEDDRLQELEKVEGDFYGSIVESFVFVNLNTNVVDVSGENVID